MHGLDIDNIFRCMIHALCIDLILIILVWYRIYMCCMDVILVVSILIYDTCTLLDLIFILSIGYPIHVSGKDVIGDSLFGYL